MASASLTLIPPQFVFPYPFAPTNVSDYRCVVNAAGTSVIVERTVLSVGAEPQLCLVDLATATATTLFPALEETTRPDWCWRTGEIAFNYDPDQKVGVLPKLGEKHTLFPDTARMDYPTWFPDGAKLATESSA